MNKYTIHCTSEQSKRAFELGAPILKENRFSPVGWKSDLINSTAEQMLGWLEEHGVVIDILSHYIGCDEHEKSIYVYDWMRNDEYTDDITYETRKEATLAAIDAALEYLTNNSLK